MVWHVYNPEWDESLEAYETFIAEHRARKEAEHPSFLPDGEPDDDYDVITDGGE
jgi:hypothetical protein